MPKCELRREYYYKQNWTAMYSIIIGLSIKAIVMLVATDFIIFAMKTPAYPDFIVFIMMRFDSIKSEIWLSDVICIISVIIFACYGYYKMVNSTKNSMCDITNPYYYRLIYYYKPYNLHSAYNLVCQCCNAYVYIDQIGFNKYFCLNSWNTDDFHHTQDCIFGPNYTDAHYLFELLNQPDKLVTELY